MDKKILTRTTALLSALDFSVENGRIAELEEAIVGMQDAVARGEARCAEISQALRSERVIDGRQVGDALLAGASGQEATLVAPSREALSEERSALQAGITDLRRRIEDTGLEIEAIKRDALASAARVVTPVIDDLMREATEIAGKLPALFAALYAINLTTHAGRAEITRLSDSVSGLIGHGRLLPDRRTEPVPAEVAAMLDPLSNKGKAIFARRTASVVIT